MRTLCSSALLLHSVVNCAVCGKYRTRLSLHWSSRLTDERVARPSRRSSLACSAVGRSGWNDFPITDQPLAGWPTNWRLTSGDAEVVSRSILNCDLMRLMTGFASHVEYMAVIRVDPSCCQPLRRPRSFPVVAVRRENGNYRTQYVQVHFFVRRTWTRWSSTSQGSGSAKTSSIQRDCAQQSIEN